LQQRIYNQIEVSDKTPVSKLVSWSNIVGARLGGVTHRRVKEALNHQKQVACSSSANSVKPP